MYTLYIVVDIDVRHRHRR